MPKKPGGSEEEGPNISQMELCECVATDNEIRLLRMTLEEKRKRLRRRLKEGAEVEDGPLKSFATRLARGYFPLRRMRSLRLSAHAITAL
jgi:hypothetical protein